MRTTMNSHEINGTARWLAAVSFAVFGSTFANAEPLRLYVRDAALAYDQRTGQPLITYRMTADSQRDFARFTQNQVGKKIDIRVDGKTLFQPVVREPIFGSVGQIIVTNAVEGAAIAKGLTDGSAILEVEASKD